MTNRLKIIEYFDTLVDEIDLKAEKLLAKLIEDKELLDYKNMLGNLHRNEVKKTNIKKILIPSLTENGIVTTP